MTARWTMFPALLALACGQPAASPSSRSTSAPTIVRGHVLDEHGKPLPLAHITLDGRPMQVGTDGAFSISFAPRQRLTKLKVTGAAHREEHLLIAREDHDVDVTIKLGAPAPQGEANPVFVLGSRENFKNHVMSREPDGSYSVTVQAPDGRYEYFIGGVMNHGPSAEPTDGYVLTNDGQYHPQIVIKGGSARITFDARKLHESFSTIELAPSAPTSAALTATCFAWRKSASDSRPWSTVYSTRKVGLLPI